MGMEHWFGVWSAGFHFFACPSMSIYSWEFRWNDLHGLWVELCCLDPDFVWLYSDHVRLKRPLKPPSKRCIVITTDLNGSPLQVHQNRCDGPIPLHGFCLESGAIAVPKWHGSGVRTALCAEFGAFDSPDLAIWHYFGSILSIFSWLLSNE